MKTHLTGNLSPLEEYSFRRFLICADVMGTAAPPGFRVVVTNGTGCDIRLPQSTDTRIKLPDYAVATLLSYGKSGKLLPQLSCGRLNLVVKELCLRAGWTQPVHKQRERRGVGKKITLEGKPYRFCDLVTTHTRRRTAITTMLCLGMPEWMVRQLSGHSAVSKDFFRYVSYAQQFIDRETDRVFTTLTGAPKRTESGQNGNFKATL